MTHDKLQTTEKPERLHIAAPPRETCLATIVIPVRDEAELIRRTLERFLIQQNNTGEKFDRSLFEIIVLVNNSRDDSAQIVKNFARENPSIALHLDEREIAPANAHIGFVRRLLFNEAFVRQFSRGGVLLTTDGDTEVSENWIQANLNEIETGADAVGGRILIKPEELEKMDAATREIHLKDDEYRLKIALLESIYDYCEFDAAPRHHQHFNGSFAVKAAAFARAGGIPKVKYLEDCAFFDALQRADAKVRHSFDVVVYTSARCVGRSEVGLSYQLNEWKKIGARGESFLVESPAAAIERFRLRRDLREFYADINKKSAAKISAETKLSIARLMLEARRAATFGLFYERISAALHKLKKPPAPISLQKALDELAEFSSDFQDFRAPVSEKISSASG